MTLRNDHNTTFVQVIYRNVRKFSPCDHKVFSFFFITAPFLRGLGKFTRFMLPHDSGHGKFPEDSEKNVTSTSSLFVPV